MSSENRVFDVFIPCRNGSGRNYPFQAETGKYSDKNAHARRRAQCPMRRASGELHGADFYTLQKNCTTTFLGVIFFPHLLASRLGPQPRERDPGLISWASTQTLKLQIIHFTSKLVSSLEITSYAI